MYADEMPVIRDAMRANVEVFRRGAMFAVCSIRQPTVTVPDQLEVLFDPTEDNNENPLFGSKFAAFDWVMGPAGARAWAELRAPLGNTKASCEYGIMQLLKCPGLGIVKAAFILQLMGYDVACLDSRNVARLGLNPRRYRLDKAEASPRLAASKVRQYVAETFGQARIYWDDWCSDVAAAYGKTPDEISKLHLAIVPANWVPF